MRIHPILTYKHFDDYELLCKEIKNWYKKKITIVDIMSKVVPDSDGWWTKYPEDFRRFLEFIEIDGECWRFTRIGQNGYGHFALMKGGPNGTSIINAYSASYLFFRGERKKTVFNEVLRHTCHNKWCVNPNHLTTGSYGDNAQDSIKHGTYNNFWSTVGVRRKRGEWGEWSTAKKLNDEKVKRIKGILITYPNLLLAEIGKEFGVSYSAIRDIKLGRCWTHIEEYTLPGPDEYPNNKPKSSFRRRI